jgi:Zn-dependent oligopeptidase
MVRPNSFQLTRLESIIVLVEFGHGLQHMLTRVEDGDAAG